MNDFVSLQMAARRERARAIAGLVRLLFKAFSREKRNAARSYCAA
jgi:hypothetical protein